MRTGIGFFYSTYGLYHMVKFCILASFLAHQALDAICCRQIHHSILLLQFKDKFLTVRTELKISLGVRHQLANLGLFLSLILLLLAYSHWDVTQCDG